MPEQFSEADIFAAGTETHVPQPKPREPERNDPQPRETVSAEEERPTPNLGQLPDQGEPAEQGGDQRPEDPFARERAGFTRDLQAERTKRQEHERALAERDRQMAEMRGQMGAMQEMFRQMGGPQPRQPQQPEAPMQAPDPFEDPQGFAQFQAEQMFERRFAPFQQQFEAYQQQQRAVMQGLQRQTAVGQYGADEVKDAEEAFNTAAARNALDPLEHQRINTSPNPYAAAVEWRRRQRTFEQVGADPSKWFENQFTQRLQGDPAFQQQVYALLTGQAREAAGAAPAAPAAPGGKPPPVFAGLPSLNAAAGHSARQQSQITEADIFSAAPPNMGGRR